MITTVTLNVAIDKAYKIKELNKGEVMRVLKCNNTPGGKGLNVARVIKLLGEDVLATGFVGGHSGAYVEDMLKEQEVPNDFFHIASESRVCINVLEDNGTSTEFLEPGEGVKPQEICNFVEKFEKIVNKSEVITISGSAPKGVNSDIYAKLITMTKEKGKKVILDTSGDLLKEGIKACPTMIKPNKDEIESLFGVSVNNRQDLIDYAKKIQELGIDQVVVSLGADGAIVVTKDGTVHGKPPKIIPVNTVGSGDSMVAALAVGLARGYDIEESLRYAVAVSAANTLTMTTGFFKKQDMESIYKNVRITSV